MQYFPRVDLEGVLNTFLTDLKAIIPRTCGFPVKMTSTALYATQELTQSSLQVKKKLNVSVYGFIGCNFGAASCVM